MSDVRVRIKSGTHYHTDGERKKPGDELVVTQSVYDVFKFKFELLGASETPAPVAQRAMPNNATADALALIQERSVDWAHITGSGKDGRLLKKDVLAYLEQGS